MLQTHSANGARFAQGPFEAYTQFIMTFEGGPNTKHAWVPLPKDIRVDSPPDSACLIRGA